jgi:glycosyltransferase involved in cell wall biosynthesis
VDGGASRQMIEETGRLLETRRQPGGRFTIVATGGLNQFNGFREVLAAFAHLEGSSYRLIVAGRGPLGAEVEAAAGKDRRIEFRGFLTHPEVLALHAEADVLLSVRITGKLNTSYAFPSKTFEYLLSGVPVITTATGHMRTEYGPYCFILEEQSAQALAGLLRRVESLAPAERSRIGLSARQFIIDHKAWDLQHGRIAEFVRSTAMVKPQVDPTRPAVPPSVTP